MKHAFGALAIGSSLWVASALAYAPPQGLAQCMAPLPDTPDLVQETAQNWLHHGGGSEAHECLAQADLALGDYRDAAGEYEALSAPGARQQTVSRQGQATRAPSARTAQTSDAARQAVFAEQAAGAWLLAGDGKAAERAVRQAMTEEPDRLEVRVLLARSLSMQGRFEDSIAALGRLPAPETGRAGIAPAGSGPVGAVHTEAIHPVTAPADPFPVRALVVRATAYRHLGQNDKGLADVSQALALSPDDIDALLERGILNVRLTHYAQARSDWDRVIALAPDGHEAYLARQDEAVLDADPDQD